MEYIVKINGPLPPLLSGSERLNANFVIAELLPEEADLLMFDPSVEYIEPAELVFPFVINRSKTIDNAVLQDTSTLDGSGVIIGIIDSGIDASLPLFKFPDGSSKILSLWDLTKDGNPPQGFNKGYIYNDQQILEQTDIEGHGTAVAGVAAITAPGASFIIVKMAERSARTTDIMRGVSYISETARGLQMPCVINISYGTNLGSHSGNSLFESYLNDASGNWKNLIVCATGNEGGSAHHAHTVLQNRQTTNIDFTVGTVLTSMYIDMWSNFVDDISWSLTAPDGRSISMIPLVDIDREYFLAANRISVVHRGPTHYSVEQEVIFSIIAAPGISQGPWKISFYGDSIVDGSVNLWLPTDEQVGTRTAFLLPDPYLTASIPSTAGRVVAVGGYNSRSNTLSSFSGRGSESFCDTVPDLVAPAEGVRSAKSGGGFDIFAGTSMAAPAVSGAAALLMEWGIVRKNDPFLYGQQIRAFLRKGSSRRGDEQYPNPRWGYGSLDIESTISLLQP